MIEASAGFAGSGMTRAAQASASATPSSVDMTISRMAPIIRVVFTAHVESCDPRSPTAAQGRRAIWAMRAESTLPGNVTTLSTLRRLQGAGSGVTRAGHDPR